MVPDLKIRLGCGPPRQKRKEQLPFEICSENPRGEVGQHEITYFFPMAVPPPHWEVGNFAYFDSIRCLWLNRLGLENFLRRSCITFKWLKGSLLVAEHILLVPF